MKKGILVSAAVAGVVGSLASGLAQASEKPAAPKEVKCMGGNACKGKSKCNTASNSCAGKNDCKGKGWIMAKSEDECTKAGGKVAPAAHK